MLLMLLPLIAIGFIIRNAYACYQEGDKMGMYMQIGFLALCLCFMYYRYQQYSAMQAMMYYY